MTSVFSASSLRKLQTTRFSTRIRQKGSGVGVKRNGFAGLRTSRPTSFSAHVKTPISGVAAPADSLEFSARAFQTGARITKGIRLAGQENVARQNKLQGAMTRLGRFNPTPVVDIQNPVQTVANRPSVSLTPRIADTPLNPTLSLSIASSFDRPTPRSLRVRVAQSYAAFDFTAPRFELSTTI